MTGFRFRPLVAAAVMAFGMATVGTAPAVAADTFSVDVSGIDLSTATGRELLQKRVNRTIGAVCGAPVLFDRAEAAALRACREATRADVEPQLRAVLTRASVADATPN